MKAIVTLVTGSSYRRNFDRYCHKSWEGYATRHGLDLLVFNEPFDSTPRARERSVAWQKCLVIDDPRVRKYDQIVWIDSDVVINLPKAPNVFDGVGIAEIGAVPDYCQPTQEAYRKRLNYLCDCWGRLGIPHVRNLTPEEYMTSWGLPAIGDVIQTGVLVASPRIHGAIFRAVYEGYEDKGASYWHYEMRPLSYEILRLSPVKWLELRFNLVTSFGASDDEVASMYEVPSFIERGFQKLLGKEGLIQLPRHRRLKRMYERMFNESYFLHFAGHHNHMSFLTGQLGKLGIFRENSGE